MTAKNKNYLRYNLAAAIILDPKNRILLQKKDFGYFLGPGKWCLWGGGINENETAEEAIKREIKEELDIKIEKISHFGNFPYEGVLEGKNVGLYHQIFIIKFDGNLKKIALGEGAGFAIFERSELNKLDIINSNIEILKKFMLSET